MFRAYSNHFSQATKGIAGWILTVGIALICFGILIIALPELFAFIAAGFFFLAGASVIGYAARLILMARRMDKSVDNPEDARRENVRIHQTEEHFEG